MYNIISLNNIKHLYNNIYDCIIVHKDAKELGAEAAISHSWDPDAGSQIDGHRNVLHIVQMSSMAFRKRSNYEAVSAMFRKEIACRCRFVDPDGCSFIFFSEFYPDILLKAT